MTDLLETLRALAPVVTPGEWSYVRNPENTRWIIDSEPAHAIACTAGFEPDNESNANLIVALRNALPAIIAALTAQADHDKVLAERDGLEAENARLRAWAPLVASGYEVPIASQAMEEAAIRLAEVEAERDALLEAVRPIPDDYITSETHHPNYILIPADRFAALCAALEAKPEPEPLVEVAREMVLLDGVVRTDNQKAAIREGRAANIASDDFYDRLRAALAARGLKLVEAGDAD